MRTGLAVWYTMNAAVRQSNCASHPAGDPRCTERSCSATTSCRRTPTSTRRGARGPRRPRAARRRAPPPDERADSPAARAARHRRRIDFLDPESVIPRTAIRVADARAGNFDGQRHPARPAAPVDSGHRPGAPSRDARWSRASATSPTRCSRAPTAGCSTARTRSARSSTMSLDNQRNLKLAIHRDPRVPDASPSRSPAR